MRSCVGFPQFDTGARVLLRRNSLKVGEECIVSGTPFLHFSCLLCLAGFSECLLSTDQCLLEMGDGFSIMGLPCFDSPREFVSVGLLG